MLKNPIREMIEWLKRPDPRDEVMQRRLKEAIELRKRYDYLQEEIKKKCLNLWIWKSNHKFALQENNLKG